MSRRNPPSFDYYPDDFAGGCFHLSTLQVGMYHKSIWFLWSNDFMPNDAQILQKIMGVTAEEFENNWPTLSTKFESDGNGRLLNRRLKAEKEKKLAIIEKRRKAGELGGRPASKANAKQKQSKRLFKGDPKKSKSGRRKKYSSTEEYNSAFEEFWSAFPARRRTDRPRTMKEFEAAVSALSGSLGGAESAQRFLVQRAAEYAKSEQGRSEFVRGSAVWLHQHGWEDPPEAWERHSKDPRGTYSAAERYLKMRGIDDDEDENAPID